MILEAFRLFKAFPSRTSSFEFPTGTIRFNKPPVNPVRELLHGPCRVHAFIHGIILAFSLWFWHRDLNVCVMCVFLRCAQNLVERRALVKRRENVCVFSWWSLIHSNAMTELKPEAISSMESPGRRPTLRHFQQDGHESQQPWIILKIPPFDLFSLSF